MTTRPDVTKVTSADELEWYRRHDQDLVLADALSEGDTAAMTVGFARYGAGEANPWTVVYDETLVITKGRFTVESDGKVHHCRAWRGHLSAGGHRARLPGRRRV